MSHTRLSTKVPGQKNVSRTYSWWDVSGGVIITGRGAFNDLDGAIRMSLPEALFWARNVLGDAKWMRKGKETPEQAVAREHRKSRFYRIHDAKYEKEFQQRMKKLAEDWRIDSRKQKRRFDKGLKRMKKRPSQEVYPASLNQAKRMVLAAGFEIVRKKARGRK